MSAADAPWRRLHPLSLAVNLLPQIAATLRWLWPLLLGVALGQVRGAVAFDALLLPLVLGPAVLRTVTHFATLRYRVADGTLEIESGLLQRTRRSVPRERVQNVEVVRNVFHRLAGLAEVRVETASGKEVEGLLSALSVPEAEAIVAALRDDARARGEPGPAVDEGAPLAAPGWLELLWAGATGVNLGAVPIVGFTLWRFLAPPGEEDEVARASGPAAAALVAVVLTGAFWFSVGSTFLRDWGFRLLRSGDRLVVTRGLLTTSRTELRRARVQVAIVEERPLRRLAGFAAVRLETAAGRSAGDGTERASTTIPYVDAPDVPRLLRELVPTAADPAELELVPAHPAAVGRAVARTLLLATPVVGLAAALSGPAAGAAAAGIGLAAAGLVAFSTRRQGWALTDDLLVARTATFTRTTTLVPIAKIQSVARWTTPLLARRGAALVSIRLAGRSVTLPLMTETDTDRVYARLAGPGPTVR